MSVVLREFPGLRMYNRVGAALPWDETAVHSQGALQCTRSEFIRGELARIEWYRNKGDLCQSARSWPACSGAIAGEDRDYCGGRNPTLSATHCIHR